MSKKGKLITRKSFLEQLVLWGTILVFLVLPLLYFPGRAASYVTSKQYFLIGTVDVLVVLWTWLMLNDTRYRLSWRNLIWLLPLFLFLASMTVSAVFGVDPATSFFSTVESGTGLVLLYHAFLFTCIVTSVIRVQQKEAVGTIINATLVASGILAVATFFTGDHGLVDLHSTMLNGSSGGAMMGNTLLVGAYFIFSIFFALYMLVHESRTWKKIAYLVLIALLVFGPTYFNVVLFKGIPVSGIVSLVGSARIAAASLCFGLVVALFVWLCTRNDARGIIWRSIGYAGIASLIVCGAYGIYQLITPTTRLHTFFVQESGNRITDWQEAVQGIKEKPFLGWGYENYHVVYQKYLDPVVFNPEKGLEVWALHPHNNTLEMFINGGIAGGVLYIFVIGGIFTGFYVLYRKNHMDGKTFALFTGMLVAFVIQQQMIYESIVSYVILFSFIGIIAGLSDTTRESRQVCYTGNIAAYIIGPGILLLMVPIWLYGAYFPARKVEEFQRVVDMKSDMRAKAYDHLFHSTGSYAISTDAEFFTSPLFFSYDGQKQSIRDNSLYKKVASEEITTLLTAVDPVLQQHPYDYHLALSLVQLCNLQFYFTANTEGLVAADVYATRAFELSPTDPQIYFAYAQTLVYEKKVAEAKKMLDKAIELNSNYKPAVSFKEMLQ